LGRTEGGETHRIFRLRLFGKGLWMKDVGQDLDALYEPRRGPTEVVVGIYCPHAPTFDGWQIPPFG
jgi:hypothetical protein